MLNQFSRTELLFGKEAMEKLAASRVAVFRIGGANPYKMYQDCIDGKKEISEKNAEYHTEYLHG